MFNVNTVKKYIFSWASAWHFVAISWSSQYGTDNCMDIDIDKEEVSINAH